jgi:hypothetical protein
VHGQIGHVRDCIVGMRFTMAQYPHRRFARLPGTSSRGNDNRPTAIGDQTTIQQVQRLGNPAGVQYVLNSDGIVHHRFLIEHGPLARGNRDLRQLFARRAKFMHVAHCRECVRAHGRWQTKGTLILLGEPESKATTTSGAIRTLRAAIGDERDIAEPGFDGSDGMPNMRLERGAANICGIRIFWSDTQVFCQHQIR